MITDMQSNYIPRAKMRSRSSSREANLDLSDAVICSAACLGFRSFAAVKQRRRALALQDFLAARLPRPHLHLPHYLAARSTATPVSRRFSPYKATRAATAARGFNDYSPQVRPDSQQAAAVKVLSPTRRYQQDFSFTPSESNLLSTCEPVRILGSHERVIDLASTREVY